MLIVESTEAAGEYTVGCKKKRVIKKDTILKRL